MKKKTLFNSVLFLVVCMLCVLTVNAKAATTPKINASDFSKQSSLYFFDDGSWVYSASCSPMDDARYQINVDFRCWGTDILQFYPQMTVVIWDKEEDEQPYIIADKLTIKVADNAYEYQLIESDPPWNSDIRVGITFLLPSDSNLIKDLASATQCTLVAETDSNVFTWVVSGKDYEKFFLPYVLDMVKFDFIHNVAETETNEKLLMYSPARKVHMNIGSKVAIYDPGPEPEDGDSFCEDSDGINKAKKSVFYVEMYDEKDNCLGNASGFVSFYEHYFVTTEHVVDDASYLIIWDENDKSYILDQVVAIDEEHDIAILEFQEGSKYPALKLDTNNNLKRGMPVVAIGSKGYQVVPSTGIISAFPVLEQYAGAKCIQYSASTSYESSGGCLVADNGKVIGIASAISSEGQYIGVAIPVQYLLELYSRLKSNAYNVMDSTGTNNSDILEENGKKKEDYTIITGGKINTIVAIPDDFDIDPFIMDTMSMTVQEFLNSYDEVRRTTVKDAPAIKKRTLKQYSAWDNSYYIEPDTDAGIGTRLWCEVENDKDVNNLDRPLSFVQIIYDTLYHKTSVKANAKACLAVFSKDASLLEKLLDFYAKNDCKNNDQSAGVVTSEGYLIMYFMNSMGDEYINIYDVAR